MHYLQHVPFEGPSGLAAWAIEHGHPVAGTPLFAAADLPRLDDFDWLVVLGGPMSVYDEGVYPWLGPERQLIADAVSAGKLVLGVCLGAQLIARALGARVHQAPQREIGWHRVALTPAADDSVFDGAPEQFTAFHWHGDTFDLPAGATHLARSTACEHQAFSCGRNVLALQFHIECTPDSVAALTAACAEEIVPGPYVQTADEMRAESAQCRTLWPLLDCVLSRFVVDARG